MEKSRFFKSVARSLLAVLLFFLTYVAIRFFYSKFPELLVLGIILGSIALVGGFYLLCPIFWKWVKYKAWIFLVEKQITKKYEYFSVEKNLEFLDEDYISDRLFYFDKFLWWLSSSCRAVYVLVGAALFLYLYLFIILKIRFRRDFSRLNFLLNSSLLF